MAGINTIRCTNCNAYWPKTMKYCQECHMMMKTDNIILEWNHNDKTKPYSRENEILKLQRKYDLTNDYLDFLLEEYPNSSMEELEVAVRNVWTETKPEQVEDGVLFVSCWNCQTKISSDLNVCPNCKIEFLSEINYSKKARTILRENRLSNEQSVPKGIVFVGLLTGFSGLVGAMLGYFIMQDFVTIILGLFEMALVIGLLLGSRFSYIAILVINVLDIIGSLITALTLNSLYYSGIIYEQLLLSALLSIILSIAEIFLLLMNAKYFNNSRIL